MKSSVPQSITFSDWICRYDLATVMDRLDQPGWEIDKLLGGISPKLDADATKAWRSELAMAAVAALISAQDRYREQERRRETIDLLRGLGGNLSEMLKELLVTLTKNADPDFKNLTLHQFEAQILPPSLREILLSSAIQLRDGLDQYRSNASKVAQPTRIDWLGILFARNFDLKWQSLQKSVKSTPSKYTVALTLWCDMGFPTDMERNVDGNDLEWMRNKFRAAGKMGIEF